MKIVYKIIITLIFMLMFSTALFAQSLDLKILSSKQNVKKGDEVIITVDWTEGMQAADFSLIYDNKKLKYISSDIDNMFINQNNENKIGIVWFSDSNIDKTRIEFKFKAIGEGITKLKTKKEGGFANGELKMPEEYNEGNITINISKSNSILKIVLIICIIIFLILIINKKIKGGKKNETNKKS